MRMVLAVLSFVIGGWMLADGIFVIFQGKYIGPEKPGPWARPFELCNINVFKLGPLFIVFGVAWLGLLTRILLKADWSWSLGITLSILSLWYLPVGTLVSVMVIVLLLIQRKQG